MIASHNVNNESYHLILGGGGFIGRHVALRLARMGKRVRLADRERPKFAFPPDVSTLVTWTQCDIATADWRSVIEGAETIHHYAWTTIPATANSNPMGDISSNVVPTIRLLEALRSCSRPPRLIFASSGGTVYGKLQQVPASEAHPLAPTTAYGAAKASVELYMGHYRALYGLDCRVARLANPFGAGQDVARGQGAATTFLWHALADRPITIWGDGGVVRDYIHISDAAEGLVALASATQIDTPQIDTPWIFNIGSGHGVSLNGLVEELEAHLGRKLKIQREHGRRFDVPVNVLDVTLARVVLDWSPHLSFSDGILRALEDLQRGADISTLGYVR